MKVPVQSLWKMSSVNEAGGGEFVRGFVQPDCLQTKLKPLVYNNRKMAGRK